MDVIFHTNYNPPPRSPLRVFEKTKTEQAYVPIKEQIERFIVAGENLMAARSIERFDYETDDIPDGMGLQSDDPVYDRAAAEQSRREHAARIRAEALRRTEARKAESVTKSPDKVTQPDSSDNGPPVDVGKPE